jgi:hypothetical protein
MPVLRHSRVFERDGFGARDEPAARSLPRSWSSSTPARRDSRTNATALRHVRRNALT